MANGRRIPASRSERYLGSLAYSNGGQGPANGSGEFVESDVWAMTNGADLADGWTSRAAQDQYGGYSRTRRQHTGHLGGLSLAFDASGGPTPARSIVHQLRAREESQESQRRRSVASSAPVNVPDWSKIHRVDSLESLYEPDEDEVNESGFEPPHEYLARVYAQSRKMAAGSVFEGVGRTLKGRDLSRVRDAVWSQTGFDG